MEALLSKLVFLYLSIVLIVTAILVITNRNAVHAVLWMLVMFFHQAVLFITLDAEFLAAVQVIVYAGAVLVLFLFVVYMINLRTELKVKNFMDFWPQAILVCLALIILIVKAISDFRMPPPVGDMTPKQILLEGHAKILGKSLFTEHILSFEVVGVLLLVAVLGAVVLTRRIRMKEEEL
ncbi:NADH-quinone oxidoreductase subunit J family protein [Thermodesulfatator atlanticus]|uniref:NADH-quinone oxidoreductase subunit J family protein n=1 Tax=Thermodesulfatator atlanticus TaxID=501497 RepID=UPI0003B5A1C9|nr:NADH-quinone oxidoreductase subunit J [Thermodesulfatator atlanticus]